MADDFQKATPGTRSAAISAVDFQAPAGKSDPQSAVARGDRPSVSKTTAADPGTQQLSTATAAYTAARSGGKRPWWHSEFNLMIAVFALLATAALLFVALAPPPEVQITSVAKSGLPERLPDADAPWTQSQLTEARSKSQAILANLLDSKKTLEEKGVEQWAPEGFTAALDLASEGDEAYKTQDFATALSKYQAAVDKMDSLFDFLPREIANNLQQGRAAITQGKSELARQKFNRVLELDEGNIEATAGLDRARRLDQALQLMAAARQFESRFEQSADLADLQSAEAQLLQASQLDSEYAPLTESLQRVQNLITDKRFKSAMSQAYKALFDNRYVAARRAFAQALKIKPGDKSAARAMQQALASDQSASISSLLSAARRYEQQEEWASAQSNYQTVLQRDPNQVGAKLGNIRSSARLQLDTQLQEMLSDPLALAVDERNQLAAQVLKDARAISDKGTRLQQQIASLTAALEQTDAVVKVSLLSDNATNVTLQKVGAKAIDLGQFQRKNLALKPGRYIATGVRLGYQDVRRDIDLLPAAQSVQSFTIKCDEAIRLSSVSGGM